MAMKDFFKDKDRRKGMIGSFVVHLALLLIFIFFGLKYYEPKPEDGIVINFGNSETGMGNEADGAPQTVVEETTPEQTTPDPVETPTEAQTPTQTQDVVEAPSVETKKSNKPKEEEKPKPVEPEKPKPSSELEKMLESVKNAKSGGEGEKEGPGDQGDPDGDPNSPSRTGSSGGGGGGGNGNYMLGGRQALNKPKPEYPCTEEGRVVVKIYVDQNGRVTNAIPGERVPGGAATTTTSSCLFDKAKAAAMRTTWQPDGDAPNPQIGYIVYNFQKR